MKRSGHPVRCRQACAPLVVLALRPRRAWQGSLSGCNPFMFGSPAPRTKTTCQPAQTAQSYPILGTVPHAAPATSSRRSASRSPRAWLPTSRMRPIATSSSTAPALSSKERAKAGTGDDHHAPAPAASDTSGSHLGHARFHGDANRGDCRVSAGVIARLQGPGHGRHRGTRPCRNPRSTAAPSRPRDQPLAPPPDPLPRLPQCRDGQCGAPGAGHVDQSQLGGAPPREQLYPAPYAPGTAPGRGAPAHGTAVRSPPRSTCRRRFADRCCLPRGWSTALRTERRAAEGVALLQRHARAAAPSICRATKAPAAPSYGDSRR